VTLLRANRWTGGPARATRKGLPVIRTGLVIVAATVALVGCQSTLALPIDPLGQTVCGRGVGLDATLHGSATDSRVAWATDDRSGQRFELIWPPGYRAAFDPRLAVLDNNGRIVARDGDQITGGCDNVDDPLAPVWVSGDEISHLQVGGA
jgi:hypothetical protein